MLKQMTIPACLEDQAAQAPNKPAIIGLSQKPLTYNDLWGQVTSTVASLNIYGIGRNDPIAIVLPNGPLMATAFLSIVSGAACAPLNPAYTTSEYTFYLKDINAKAVIVEMGSENPLINVAEELGIPILYLIPDQQDKAIRFKLSTTLKKASCSNPGFAHPGDIALILHTSGTTSRPKMVPLTHKNLCSSARNIQKTLRLNADDLCLNIMPLFHIHGLVAAVLGSMVSGGGIICTPGFYINQFLSWLNIFHPTWYTAVPTIHQSILIKVQNNPEVSPIKSLRFIRSSSASLPPVVMDNLEKTFGVPVIEAYGMTEAAHQMASNPLPPFIRKAGSVGTSAGPKIAIMDIYSSKLLPNDTHGEIVICGENVTLGYLNNPEANQKSFNDGWFRTGDQGYLDDEGYLFITGRLKEIINRGGEKISPREVDEVLLKHPLVTQAVTFAIPDPELGEVIGAAVVLNDKSINETDLKVFAAGKLAPHKVPDHILILDDIPKGPTGKLQRIGLAEKLGISSNKLEQPGHHKANNSPATDLEIEISKIWQKILGTELIGVFDNFRDVGGDSMLATLAHQEMELTFGIKIPLIQFINARNITEQAKLMANLIADKNKPSG